MRGAWKRSIFRRPFGAMLGISGVYPRAVIILGAISVSAVSASSSNALVPVSPANFCVTEGTVEELPGHLLSVTVPKMRAYLNALTLQTIEARFTYQGATGSEARLGSGALRRQFGLKLRAQDACNVVYAMWRMAPESKLVVSIKSNPGQDSSAQCGNRGYRNVKPRRDMTVPALRVGDTHVIRAEMNGAEMKVFIDNSTVWEGFLGQDALAFDGPVGIRSDNARLQMQIRVGPVLHAQRGGAPICRSSEESE